MVKDTSEKKFPIKQLFDPNDAPSIDGYFSIGDARWSVARLIQLSKDYPVHEVPVFAMAAWMWPWEDTLTIEKFCRHAKRVKDADMQYPILISPDGGIIDGVHRLCKAIINEEPTIKVKYFTKMPECDSNE